MRSRNGRCDGAELVIRGVAVPRRMAVGRMDETRNARPLCCNLLHRCVDRVNAGPCEEREGAHESEE